MAISKTKLQEIAKRLIADTADQGAIVEDGISICEYVSRSYGIELTVEQGGLVRDIMDSPRKKMVEFGGNINGALELYPLPALTEGIELPSDIVDGQNGDRAKRVETALTVFANDTGLLGLHNEEDVSTVVSDFLSDLGHFCDRRGIDLPDLISMAGRRYNEETSGDNTAACGSQFEGLA